LAPSDEVALEATGNTNAIVRALRGRVARVVVVNPMKTRAIAEAKVKTDKVDGEILAQLLAADYLPAVWMADEQTQARRRQVARLGAHRPPAHPAEEPGAGGAAAQPDCALPGRGPVRDQGSCVACRAADARR
jgi:hypothetical protein